MAVGGNLKARDVSLFLAMIKMMTMTKCMCMQMISQHWLHQNQ